MATDIRFRLGIDGVDQVKQGAAQAAQSLESIGAAGTKAAAQTTGVLSSIGGAVKAVAGLAIANELVQAAKAAVQTADAITTLQNKLQLATGSAAAASQSYQALFRIAQDSRTSFTELGGTFASIARATDSLGISQARLLKVTESIGNALAISGGSAQSMQAALVQLGQGLASGTLRGDELNSVLEQTPRLARAIADGMGVTVGKLRELGAEGKITAEAVLQALESQSATLAREVGGSVVTVGQAFTQMSNSATKAIGQLNDATGTTSSLASGIQSLSRFIDDTADRFERAREAGHGAFGTIAVAQILATAEALGYVDQRAGNIPRKLEEAGKELAKLQERFAQRGGYYLAQEVQKAEELVKTLREAKEAQDDLKAERSTSQSAQFGEASQSIAAIARKGIEAQQKAEEALGAARSQALGVNASWLKQVLELNTARQAGYITEKQYVEVVKALTAETYKVAAAHKKEHEAMDEAVKDFRELSKAGREWARGIESTNVGLAKELDLGRQLTEGEQKHLELTTKLATGQLVMTSATEKATRAAIDHGQALRDNVAWQRQATDENERSFQRLEDETSALEQRAAAMRLGNDQQLLAASAVREVERANLLALAVEKERRAVLADLIDPDVAAEYRKQAAALREQAAQSGRAAAIEASKEAGQAWQQMAQDAGQALSQALMDGGKSGADSVKAYFRSLFGRELAGLFASAIGSLGQYVGGGGSGAVGQYASGGANSLSTLNTLYGAGKTGWGWLTGSSAATGAGTTAAFTSGATTAPMAEYAGTTAAASGSSAASAIPIIGWIIAAIMASDAAYKGGNTVDMLDKSDRDLGVGAFETHKYKTLSKLGFSDKWAQILSGAPLTARLFGHKASSSGYGIGSVSQGDFISDNVVPFQYGDNTLGTGRSTDLEGLSSDLIASLALSASQFGGRLQEGLRVGSFTDRDREGKVSALLGYFGSQNTLIAGTQTGTGAFGTGGPSAGGQKIDAADFQSWVSEQMPVLLVQGLQQSDLADRFSTYFDSIAASTLTSDQATQMLKTAEAVAQLTDAFDPLGGALSQLSELSVESFQKLANASGGFDALGQSLQSYYQQFYSEADRTKDAWAGITKTLNSVGVEAIPTTREGFRALVDSLKDLGSTADQQTFAALMKVSGAFDALIDASDQASAKLAQEAAQRAQSAQQIVDQNIGKFINPPDLQRYKAGRIAQDLAAAGLGVSVDQLLGASKQDILAFVRSMVDLGDGASETEVAILAAAGALADLKDEAASAADVAAAAAAQRASTLADALKSAQQEALDGVLAAYQQVQQQVDGERQRIETETDSAIQSAQQKADAGIRQLETQASQVERVFGSMLDGFEDNIRRLTGQIAGDDGRGQALKTLRSGLAALQSGQSVDADTLRTAASQASNISTASFASRLDYQRELASTANLLRDLSGAARGQMTSQLGDIAGQQVAIEKGLEDQTAALKEASRSQLASLEDQLRTARGQAESLVRIDDGVQSLGSALAALAAAVSAAGALQGKGSAVTGQWQQSGSTEVWSSSGGAVGTRPAGSTDLGQLVIKGKQSVFTGGEARNWVNAALVDGRESDIVMKAIAEGIDSTSLDALMGWAPGTALREALKRGLPAFATGTAFVPSTGTALVHEGERIIPAADNAALMRMMSESTGTPGRDELLAEIREMRRILEASADFDRLALPPLVRNTRKTYEMLDAMVYGRVSIPVKVVTTD